MVRLCCCCRRSLRWTSKRPPALRLRHDGWRAALPQARTVPADPGRSKLGGRRQALRHSSPRLIGRSGGRLGPHGVPKLQDAEDGPNDAGRCADRAPDAKSQLKAGRGGDSPAVATEGPAWGKEWSDRLGRLTLPGRSIAHMFASARRALGGQLKASGTNLRACQWLAIHLAICRCNSFDRD
jgi:hypothetical protein